MHEVREEGLGETAGLVQRPQRLPVGHASRQHRCGLPPGQLGERLRHNLRVVVCNDCGPWLTMRK